jgi:hypothetical protein
LRNIFFYQGAFQSTCWFEKIKMTLAPMPIVP